MEVVVEGKKVAYLQEGQGENILFLHGYLSCKESFYYQIQHLRSDYKVTALDFIGFGKSDALTEAWSVADYAKHTLAFLKNLQIDKTHIVAHSFGGRVALWLLAHYPQYFQRAVLTGCAGLIPKRGLKYHLKVNGYKLCKKIFPNFAKRHFGSKEYRTLSPIMQESYKKIVNDDLFYCLAKIKSETLYIFGENDKDTPLYMANTLQANTPNAKLHIIKGGTHFCFCEQVALFNDITLKFLQYGNTSI